ncbi:permease [Bacillus sp. Gen3]|nr:permease [Bacillus sp. Gen3]
MYSRVAYFICGIILLSISGFLIVSSIMNNNYPPSYSILILALAVIAFCAYYLFPQFKQKDERMKLIRQKGMFVSYFALVIYFVIFIILNNFHMFMLTTMQFLHIMVSLMIMTVFLSWVVLSKRY